MHAAGAGIAMNGNAHSEVMDKSKASDEPITNEARNELINGYDSYDDKLEGEGCLVAFSKGNACAQQPQQAVLTNRCAAAPDGVDTRFYMDTHRFSTASGCSFWRCCRGAALQLRTLSEHDLLSVHCCAWQAVQ
jgi:hypothetical protein